MKSLWSAWKRFGKSFLFVSIALHLIFGVGATALIVQRVQAKRQLTFQGGPPNPSRSQRSVEHKVAVAKQRKTASAPAPPKRVAVSGLAKVSLPEMPSVPVSASALPAAKLDGLGGSGGFGLGPGLIGGAGSPGAGGGGGINFFGLKAISRSVVFIIDVTGTMIMGRKSPQTFALLEQEVENALKGLGPESQFNLITYGPEAHPFRSGLVAATESEKREALRFMKSWNPSLVLRAGETATNNTFERPNGRRHAGTYPSKAFTAAFRNKPDTVIFLSDGLPTLPESPATVLATIKRLQDAEPKPVKINVVVYYADDGQKFMADIAKQNGGQHREIK